MTECQNNKCQLVVSLPVLEASMEMKHHHEILLSMAEDAHSREEHELCVILASCASEMLVERTFRLLFSYSKVEHLYDSVIVQQWEYNNITKKKNRDLYTILSKDDIPNTFKEWSDLCGHYKRRHEVAHRGSEITPENAKKPLDVVAKFIKHIESQLIKLQPNDF